jgi:hypothetical protein
LLKKRAIATATASEPVSQRNGYGLR